MKKKIFIIIVLAMGIFTFGCGKNDKKDKEISTEKTETENKLANDTEIINTEEEYTIVDFDNSAMTVGTMTEDYAVEFTDEVAVVSYGCISEFDADTNTLILSKNFTIAKECKYVMLYYNTTFDYIFRRIESVDLIDDRVVIKLSATPLTEEMSADEIKSLVVQYNFIEGSDVTSSTPEADVEDYEDN